MGYDFTFSVPKSVSLLYAMSGDQDIMDAFRAAVDETMREMEAEMKTRVRKGRQDTDRTTGNMVWAEFIHTTSRPVDGLPDPQLHAHVFVFNTTWDEEEHRWKAGQFRELKRDAPYFQAAFRVRLANKLQDLGFGVERKRDDFEIAGIPAGCAEALFAAHGPDREGGRGEGHHRSRPQGGTRGRDPRKERHRPELGKLTQGMERAPDRQGAQRTGGGSPSRAYVPPGRNAARQRRSITPSSIVSCVRRWCRNASSSPKP